MTNGETTEFPEWIEEVDERLTELDRVTIGHECDFTNRIAEEYSIEPLRVNDFVQVASNHLDSVTRNSNSDCYKAEQYDVSAYDNDLEELTDNVHKNSPALF